MTGPAGNGEFFPLDLNIKGLGETKLTVREMSPRLKGAEGKALHKPGICEAKQP